MGVAPAKIISVVILSFEVSACEFTKYYNCYKKVNK